MRLLLFLLFIVEVIVGAFSRTVEVFLHHRFGHRYLNRLSLFTVPLLVLAAAAVLLVLRMGFGGFLDAGWFLFADPRRLPDVIGHPESAFLVVLAMVAWWQSRSALEAFREEGIEEWSHYPGDPWLAEILPEQEHRIRTSLEPTAVAAVGVGLLVSGVGGAVSLYLLWCAACLYLKNLIENEKLHSEATDILDDEYRAELVNGCVADLRLMGAGASGEPTVVTSAEFNLAGDVSAASARDRLPAALRAMMGDPPHRRCPKCKTPDAVPPFRGRDRVDCLKCGAPLKRGRPRTAAPAIVV